MARVLVIEDERKLLRSLQRGLQAEGYEVATASTGEEGLRLAMSQPFDCVLLDWVLPGPTASRCWPTCAAPAGPCPCSC